MNKRALLLVVSGLASGCGNGGMTTYSLTLTPGVHGILSADPAGPTYSRGALVKLTATAEPQWKVVGWSGTDADTSTSPVNSVTMNADKTVSVQFGALTQQQFSVTLGVPGGHGTITANPPGPSYLDGTLVTLTAAADPGYKLQAWQGTDDDTLATTTNNLIMTSDRSVTVQFAPVTQQRFTLTLGVPGGHGTITANPLGPSYLDGTLVNLAAVADQGFTFQSWHGTDNDALTSATNTVVMTSDRAVSAVFAVSSTCPVDPVTGNAVAQMISPVNGATLPAGAVTFEWCNAQADYFLSIETVRGAHDVFFAFAGGPGAGVTSLTLGPGCASTQPTGCIPSLGEPVYVTLYTVKHKQILAPSPFFYQYAAARP
jgi:hypothetical protein